MIILLCRYDIIIGNNVIVIEIELNIPYVIRKRYWSFDCNLCTIISHLLTTGQMSWPVLYIYVHTYMYIICTAERIFGNCALFLLLGNSTPYGINLPLLIKNLSYSCSWKKVASMRPLPRSNERCWWRWAVITHPRDPRSRQVSSLP